MRVFVLKCTARERLPGTTRSNAGASKGCKNGLA